MTKGGKGGIIWNCATEKAEGRKKKIKKVEKTSWQEGKKCGIINMLCRKQREKEIKKVLDKLIKMWYNETPLIEWEVGLWKLDSVKGLK